MKKPLRLAALVAVLAGAAVLRFINADWGGTHPDEPITIEVVRQLERSGVPDTNWKHAAVPERFRYDQYNFSSYMLACAAADSVLRPAFARLWKDPVHYDGAVRLMFLRYLSAGLGVLACLLTYLLARHFVPPWFAIFAAVLAACFPLLVQDGHYGRPEAFVTAVFVAALLCLEAAGRRGPLVAYAGGCLLFGILLAAKISFAPLLFVVLAPLVWDAVPVRKFAVAGAAALVLGAAMGAPYALVNPRVYWKGIQVLTSGYAVPFGPYSPFPSGYCFGMIGRHFLETCGGAVLLLACVAVVTLVAARRWKVLAMVIAPLAVSYAMFGIEVLFMERNLSHVAPLYAVAAAIGLAALWSWSALPYHIRTGTAVLVAVAALVVPLHWSWAFAGRVLDRRERARVNAGEAVLASPFGKPEIFATALFTPEELTALRAKRLANPGGFLLRVNDFNDPFSKDRAALICRTYGMRYLGTLSHPLDGLSVSTLWSHFPRASYYLVPPDGSRTPVPGIPPTAGNPCESAH